MMRVGLRMLIGDRTKCLALVLGVAFSVLLICQQMSIFFCLLGRASNVVNDVREADIWVMDRSVKTIDVPYPLRDTELARVRGVKGVAWAVPFFRGQVQIRTHSGSLENSVILGIDDASLVGVPDAFVLGAVEDLARPEAIAINPEGFRLLFPGEPLSLGKELELNDQRARIVAIVKSSPSFTANFTIFARYSLATGYTNNGRNQLSYILAKAAPGLSPERVARDIASQTGLKAETSKAFRQQAIDYILVNTPIPIVFGTVVALGVIIGIAVVGLTFNQFVMENLKQYAALKAIGVRGSRILLMTLGQAAFVLGIGYSLGLFVTATFFDVVPKKVDSLRGFYLLPEVAVAVAVLAAVIVFVSTILSLRRVMVVDPATVFRG